MILVSMEGWFVAVSRKAMRKRSALCVLLSSKVVVFLPGLESAASLPASTR